MNTMTKAATDVLAERKRQIEAEGRSPERDDGYTKGELSAAGAAYACAATEQAQEWDDGEDNQPPRWWPWPADWWKPTDQRRNLVKAAALLLAEIERLDRAEEASCRTASAPEAA